MMERMRVTIVPGLLAVAAVALLAMACDWDSVSPEEPQVGPTNPGGVNFDHAPGHKKDKGFQPANFRLTGGGRVDKPEPLTGKNTPESRDFATFGFQARPQGPGTTAGEGQITWVEHNPAAIGGGFTFHGRVSEFTKPVDETAGDDDCGRFAGSGRARTRDGQTFDNVTFVVEHACDKGEPGVARDHIKINIAGAYFRHGLLSGGNIQKHRLTGNA